MSNNKLDLDVFVQDGCDSNRKILKLVESNPNIKNEVVERSDMMGQKAVNVKETMHNLVAVGKFLQIADLGSQGLKTNIAVKGF